MIRQLYHHPIGDAPISRAINIKNIMSSEKLSIKPITNSCISRIVFIVYGLEEYESPPWEGDDMSARFIGELVHQENLVLMASGGDSHPYSSRGLSWFSSDNCESISIPCIFLQFPDVGSVFSEG